MNEQVKVDEIIDTKDNVCGCCEINPIRYKAYESEYERLKRLDENIKNKIEELQADVTRLAELGEPPDFLDKIKLLESLYK